MIPVVVASKVMEALDICSLQLQSVDSAALPEFEPGAHIDVHLPNGMVRQYSLCNKSHGGGCYQIAVLKDPSSRGGSILIHDELRPGAQLAISRPRNHFPLVSGSDHVLLLAGGIGITPLLAMAERLGAERRSFELHYCTRSEERTAFRERLADPSVAQQTHFYFDDGPPERRFPCSAVLASPRERHRIYVCGPSGFIDFVREVAAQTGWPQERIHQEYFSAQADDGSVDEEFEVTLAKSNKVLRVPAHMTLAEALQEEGVAISVSCEQGICGACITRVLGGEPLHRDQILTPKEHAEGRYMTPCVSRARKRGLILDL